MMEEDAGRNFKELDAHEAQEALAEEFSEAVDHSQDVLEAVTDESEKPSKKKKKAKPAEPAAPEVEWSDEEIAEHKRMVEALLFAASEALDEKSIADRLPVGAGIAPILEMLAAEYEGRGVTLKKAEDRWRFVTAADVAHVLEKEKVTQRRLSRAALETLAIIAYHQPCTRADIEDVRGVQVAKGSLDQLLEIGWVRMKGKRRDVPGRPTLYGTTNAFLEHFGLETVTDLPGLADLKAAGLLDARLPPGFAVPSPADGDDEDYDDDDDSGEFAQDFLDDDGEEAADA